MGHDKGSYGLVVLQRRRTIFDLIRYRLLTVLTTSCIMLTLKQPVYTVLLLVAVVTISEVFAAKDHGHGDMAMTGSTDLTSSSTDILKGRHKPLSGPDGDGNNTLTS